MANSDQQTQILSLGKAFVSELSKGSRSDTLSKWMAFYIAEKIVAIEGMLDSDEKNKAQRECFELILKIWDHRWSSDSTKPFEKFEPILRSLEAISPNKHKPYYYHNVENAFGELEEKNPDLKSILTYSKLALQVDKTARILIDDLFHLAALKAITDNGKTMLENAVLLPEDYDIITIRLLLKSGIKLSDKSQCDDGITQKASIEKLKEKVDLLHKFSKVSELLMKSYKSKIEDIKLHSNGE